MSCVYRSIKISQLFSGILTTVLLLFWLLFQESSLQDDISTTSSSNCVSDNQLPSLNNRSPSLSEETWESIFLLLLEVLTKALGSSKCHNAQDGLDKFLDNIFDIWTLACCKQYPGSTFWKSLDRILKHNSLHYNTLRSWSSQFLKLNQKLVEQISKHGIEAEKSDAKVTAIELLNSQQLIHTWYRFFHFPVNPALLLEFKFPDHLAAQIPQDEEQQVKFYSLLALKVASTVASAVYQFMGIESDSVIRSQLLVASISTVNNLPNGTNSGVGTQPTATSGQSTNQAFNSSASSRRSNRNNASFKNVNDALAASATVIEQVRSSKVSSYPLFVTSSEVQTSVESLLNAFGDFLFKICLTGPGIANELVYAQAEALTCLLRLFGWKRDTETISLQYYSIFNCCIYRALNLQFETANCDVTCYVILSSCNLFCNGARFCNQLVPTYVNRIFQYCSEEESFHSSIESSESKASNGGSIRCHVSSSMFWKACYHVLLTTFPYFIKFNDIHSEQLPFPAYLDKVTNFCYRRLSQETDPASISLLISLLHSLIEMSNNRDFLGSMLSVEGIYYRESANSKLINLLIKRAFSEWSEDSQGQPILTALAFLRTLARSNFTYESYRFIVIPKLCELIEKLLQKPPRHHKTALHSLIVSCYRTIALWLENRPTIFTSEKLYKPVLDSIEYGISGSKSQSNDALVYKEVKTQHVPSQRCNDAAELLLNSLLNTKRKRTRKKKLQKSEIKQTECSSNKLDLYYLSGKERFVHIEEDRGSDSAEAEENNRRNEELTLSISSPFGNESFRVFDRISSDAERPSTATIIPARRLGAHNSFMWDYIPGQIPFIPEPLADAIFCEPEVKLSSLTNESCYDDQFCNIVNQSIESERNCDNSRSVKLPQIYAEPVPVEPMLHSKKFVAKFPFLTPTKVESQDFKSNSNLEHLPFRTAEGCGKSSSICDVHEIMQRLPLKLSQLVNVFYIPSDEMAQKFSRDNTDSLYFAQREARLNQNLKMLVDSLHESNDIFKQNSSEFNSLKFSAGSYCDILYNTFPVNVKEANMESVQNKWYDAKELTYSSAVNVSSFHPNLQSQSHPQVHIYLFAIRSFDQLKQASEEFISSLIRSQNAESEQNHESATSEVLNYVIYSFYIHSNSLITIYIRSNLKCVSFHPLADKCVIRSEDFAAIISKSIRSSIFDWTIEHVTPCSKRRECIQKLPAKVKSELLSKDSLWNIRKLTTINSAEKSSLNFATDSLSWMPVDGSNVTKWELKRMHKKQLVNCLKTNA